MTPSPSLATCPKCHAPLSPSAPRGLCPACLMEAAGVETEAATPGDLFAAPLDLETLRRAFPQLDILAPLGAGGMGRVYKVRQPNLDRMAALKVLPPDFARDAGWVERFTREARALARLNHPNIVQVYDVGQATGGPGGIPLCWLLMEYVDGVTLRQVQRTGGLSAREALSIIPKLCDALQYAHEKGVLHRDIKPENILLDAAGTVKVADFGLAKLGGTHPAPTLTVAGARLGTAAYMAPEQIESPADVDHRADIYSLGVVLYELLTGGCRWGVFRHRRKSQEPIRGWITSYSGRWRKNGSGVIRRRARCVRRWRRWPRHRHLHRCRRHRHRGPNRRPARRFRCSRGSNRRSIRWRRKHRRICRRGR